MLPMPFSRWTTYPGHSGIDFPYARGTVFRASGHGYVRNMGYNSRGGYYLWVKYDGYPAVGYHHQDSPSTLVRVGSEVWEGTPLGKVGSLGQYSDGPHLHSEVEGRASAAGYWTVFDKNRVVGATPGGGGGGGSTTPPKPTPNPEEEIKESDDMDRLMQIDPTVNGAWYIVNYRKGTAVRLSPNSGGYQLDRVKEEIAWEAKLPNPSIIQLSGAQPVQAIAGLTIING